MNDKKHIYVSELSATEHSFHNFHFCRGNTTKRKSRFGIVEKGSGTYIYLNKKIDVCEGDIVFIPERIFCYSEWHGSPEIKVTYINCFMHYNNNFEYEPQKLTNNSKNHNILLKIKELLNGDMFDELNAYSLFYSLLGDLIPNMVQSEIPMDTTLQKAVEYITNNWDAEFSVPELSKVCCVSESKLYHLFQEQLGQTPINFLNSIKINHAIKYLENSDYSVSEISRLVNFKSENHFRKTFFNITGITPLKYRKFYSK